MVQKAVLSTPRRMSLPTAQASSPPTAHRRTRLAPSPTGSLHLGHARTFLLTWALARNQGWEIVLRMEDLDRERVKPGSIAETRDVLDWLGLECDGAMTVQSEHVERFRDGMRRLAERGAIFRCDRSRKDVRLAASAPHQEDGEVRFPPELRPAGEAFAFVDERANHRLLVDPATEHVHDELFGDSQWNPGAEIGDFLVWTKLGVPSYQLAVVIDDAHQGITDVVRGEDLLPSAARQQRLYRALFDPDRAPVPRWWHIPLVHDVDGTRLAKRRGDLGLTALKAAGTRRERLIGLIASWCGFTERPTELPLSDFLPMVTPATLRTLVARERDPAARCVATGDSIRWLLNS
jgi:glutamyl-tRNA synthetase